MADSTADLGDPLADDPFFRVVRARHPEADLVVLPPVATPGPDEPRAGLEEALARGAAVANLLDDVGTWIGPWATTPRVRWRRHAQSLREQPWGSALAATREQVPTLRRLGETLLSLGWSAGPVAGGPPRLEAARGGVRLVAAAVPNGVRVEVQGEPVALAEGVAGELDR